MRKFVGEVFFCVKEERLLKVYLMFLMSKDKLYLKAQLVSLIKENENGEKNN
jgi:hypothetical protein